jgi:hypothetical protein
MLMTHQQIKDILEQFKADTQLTPREQLLLNLVEYLLQENQALKEENQQLRDEINRLKGEKGKPKIKANTHPEKGRNNSVLKEIQEPKKWEKGAKNGKIKIDRVEKRSVDRKQLPKDIQYKGIDKVIIQEINLGTENIRFELEKWYSPSEKKTYRASVDPEYQGWEFGPNLRALIISLSTQGRMTQPLIKGFLAMMGIKISEGSLSRILTERLGVFHKEIDDVYRAGLETSPYHQTDDTGARHQGKNGYTMVMSSPLYTVFFSSESKSRFQVIQNLMGGQDLSYRFSKRTLALLEEVALSKRIQLLLPYLMGKTYVTKKSLGKEIMKRLGEKVNDVEWQQLLYYSAVTYYVEQQEYASVLKLVADDAPQFQIITIILQLCWVHLGRNFKKLNPLVPRHQEILAKFLKSFWEYYKRLEAYRINPNEKLKKILNNDFDELFYTKTGYKALDELKAKKALKKEYYLAVLDYPELPIHNNHSEQQVRWIVIKRKISYGTRSELGRKARDTLTGLMLTCKKLGISFWDYLLDRIKQVNQILPLQEIIRQKSKLVFCSE